MRTVCRVRHPGFCRRVSKNCRQTPPLVSPCSASVGVRITMDRPAQSSVSGCHHCPRSDQPIQFGGDPDLHGPVGRGARIRLSQGSALPGILRLREETSAHHGTRLHHGGVLARLSARRRAGAPALGSEPPDGTRPTATATRPPHHALAVPVFRGSRVPTSTRSSQARHTSATACCYAVGDG